MPINFWREKEHPKIKADGEYPAWLWSAQRPSLAVLNRKIASEGLRSLTLEELRRWRKLRSAGGFGHVYLLAVRLSP